MENKFVIIVPSYNNARFFQKNIESIVKQNYQNYRVIYINDQSTDGTSQLVAQLIKSLGVEDKFYIVNNTIRKLALQNIYESFALCQDDEIILVVDGDDALAHPNVLTRLNQIFSNSDIWFIWSQYINSHNGSMGCSAGVGPEVYRDNSFRDQSWRFSHLHVFRSWVTKYLKPENLQESAGKFFSSGWDVPLYSSLLELCNIHAKFIPEVFYLYNTQNNISDHCLDEPKQMRLADLARKMPKCKKIEL